MKILKGHFVFSFLFITILGCLSFESQSQNTLFYVLRDSTQNLTPELISKPEWRNQFTLAESSNLSFGFNSDNYWIRFDLKESGGYFLECTSPFVQYIDLYYQQPDGTWDVKKGGYDVLWKDKDVKHRFPTFMLSQSGEYYIHIKNNGLSFPLRVIDRRDFEEIYLQQHLFFGILIGILFVVLVLNIYFSKTLKSNAHRAYAILVLGYILFDLAGEGYLYYLIQEVSWLSRNYNSFSNVIEAFTYTSIIYYTIVFFKIPVRSVLYGTFLAFCLFWLIHALNYNNAVLSTILVEWGSTAVFVFSVLMAVRGIYIGYPGSWLFFVAYSTYFSFAVMETFHLNGYLSDFLPVSYIVMGSQFEALILGYGLASATALERETLRLGKQKVEEEKLELARDQNERLTRLVDEKTRELSAANEELMSTNEELQEQHQVLEVQKQEVEEAHKLIEQHNEKLENEVTLRTTRLIDYNQQLEQFAFITAHNLRAPVARILGIGEVMKNKLDPETTQKLMNGLIQSCNDLDSVIHDLNTILVIRKDDQQTFSHVNLADTLEKILIGLRNEVQNTGTKIEYDFSKVNQINGIQPYVESIFLNLIHNAIKYRNPEKKPHINIHSFPENNHIVMKVSDNGLGIDLARHQDKIFTLYKRFHSHVEGRGMGLFLVRSQVEAMRGMISVESKVNEGTTFTITFPVEKT